MSRRLVNRCLAAVWFIAAWYLAIPGAAAASGPPPPPDGMPVIAAGQERAVIALIQPWALGQEVVPGWFLESIKLDVTKIRFVFKASRGAQRALVLEFPGRVPQAQETTKSFAVIREVPPGVPPPVPDPLDVLAAAIKKNDVATFWSADVPNDPVVGHIGDGIAVFLGGLIFVLAHLRRQLREDPPWVAPALLGVVVAGGVLRLLLPHENLMEAWPYERLAPLAGRIYDGPILQWFNAIAGGHLFLTDVLFKSNYVLAVVMPLVMYAHARYVLHDHRSAMAAAALLAVLPEHLRFSRSDVYMIQSLATSSLTFVVLYTALTDRSRAWRVASLLILPLLCTATYFVRPENIVFVGLDLGAIYICARAAGGLSLRSFVAASIVSATALMAFVVNLLTNYSGSLEHGLSLQTLSNARHILFDGGLNTLINPWITPPAVTILAVLGAVWLWRHDDRRARSSNGLTRCYSLCGDPADRSRYRIAVHRAASSRGGSIWLHANAAPGAILDVSGPDDHFVAQARRGVPVRGRRDRHHADQGDDRSAARAPAMAAGLHRPQQGHHGLQRRTGTAVPAARQRLRPR